jgi:GST-like protein
MHACNAKSGKDRAMIELYTWTTPNGQKVSIMLEEVGLPYRVHAIDITKDEQYDPAFLKVSRNNKIPAIVDTDNDLHLMESGAILMYLAEKTGRLWPQDFPTKWRVMEWLMWQMGGLGPMSGQAGHFLNYAPEDVPYGKRRYTQEVNRLYGVMNKRLAERDYLAGDYSIADMASYPWVAIWKRLSQTMDEFPHLQRWIDRMKARPAVDRAYKKGEGVSPPYTGTMSEEQKKVLFGQTAASVSAAVR